MILIIANARTKGGLSGSDNIYLHLAKHCECRIWEMLDTDFRPFVLCYIWKIIKGCWQALWDNTHYEYVYSASDFWMDSLPALIYKMKGNKWVAGCYMKAPKKNIFYYITQQPILFLMNHFADVICVTTSDVFGFKKPTVPVHGGVDMALAYPGKEAKIYDAVFVGRLHYTKGIDELIQIWETVVQNLPDAHLVIIGDGDTEAKKIKHWASISHNITYKGYMGKERFDVYRKSKMVLYPTPYKHSHFSMGPVEAMACGCPMVSFDLDVMEVEKIKGARLCTDINDFVKGVIWLIKHQAIREAFSENAINYARSWDWSVKAPMILKEIKEKL